MSHAPTVLITLAMQEECKLNLPKFENKPVSHLPSKYGHLWKILLKRAGSGVESLRKLINKMSNKLYTGFVKHPEAISKYLNEILDKDPDVIVLLLENIGCKGVDMYNILPIDEREKILYTLLAKFNSASPKQIEMIKRLVGEDKAGFDRMTIDRLIQISCANGILNSSQLIALICNMRVNTILEEYVDILTEEEDPSGILSDLISTTRYVSKGFPILIPKWVFALLNNFHTIVLSEYNSLNTNKVNNFNVTCKPWTKIPTYARHCRKYLHTFESMHSYGNSDGEHREYHYHLGKSMKEMFETYEGYLIPRKNLCQEQVIMLGRAVARAVFTDNGRLELNIHPAILTYITMSRLEEDTPWHAIEKLVGQEWLIFLLPNIAEVNQNNIGVLLKAIKDKYISANPQINLFVESIVKIISNNVYISPLRMSFSLYAPEIDTSKLFVGLKKAVFGKPSDSKSENEHKNDNEEYVMVYDDELHTKLDVVEALEKVLLTWPLVKRNEFYRIWFGTTNLDLEVDIVDIEVGDNYEEWPLTFSVCYNLLNINIKYNSIEELSANMLSYCEQVLENQRRCDEVGLFFQ